MKAVSRVLLQEEGWRPSISVKQILQGIYVGAPPPSLPRLPPGLLTSAMREAAAVQRSSCADLGSLCKALCKARAGMLLTAVSGYPSTFTVNPKT